MTKQFLQLVAPAFFLTIMVLIGLPDDTIAQGQGKAHLMDLTVDTHEDGTKECVGEPNSLRVEAGDVIVFRAKDVPVQHLRWHRSSQAQMPAKALSMQEDNEAGFAAGNTFVLMVNSEIEETTVYFLDVKCGEEPDGPPVIIVDP